MEESYHETADQLSYRKYIPWVTVFIGVFSIALFIGINTESNAYSWASYKKWGAATPDDVWNGAWWALFTSNFLHTEIWHIGFNLYWIWIFGKKIEHESSKLFYIGFVFTSAFMSCIFQLSFSDNTGIGLSGIAYAFFGFIFIQQKTNAQYSETIDKNTINWFIAWFFICIALTYANLWQVANGGHAGGLFWGLLVGYLYRFQRAVSIGLSTLILGIASISLFWAPWSIGWLSNKAYNLHAEQKVDEAKALYLIILSKDPENVFAKGNLQQLKIHQLQKKAYDAHLKKDYKEALRLYKEVLTIDSTNEYAKVNMYSLPTP